jgi:hypothetical protein
MPSKSNAAPASSNSTATIGFEAKFWPAADKLRNQSHHPTAPARIHSNFLRDSWCPNE